MKTEILEKYDCIGFDLDNTIAEYKELELANLVYELVVEYLVDKNYFDPVDLRKPIALDINFLRKGLTIDTMRGNILSLAEDGSILQAYHGTLPLSVLQIKQIYGPDMKWDLAVQHCNDFLSTWNGDLSDKILSCLDYFNVSLPLLFARTIDSVDRIRKYSPSTEYDVWPQIKEAVSSICNTETRLPDSESQYHGGIRKNLSKYLRQCSRQFLMLLKYLKSKGKKTFLITGSKQRFGNAIASYVMSDEWMEYFDVIVFNAKKPGFFVQNRPFLTVDNGNVVEDSQLTLNGSYTQGSWSALYQLFCRVTEKCAPKCLYFGDHLVEDVYTTVKHNCCDTIAVVKELHAKNDENDVLCQSKIWDSFFYDHHNSKRTAWGKIIQQYPKSCIPSVEWLVTDFSCEESA